MILCQMIIQKTIFKLLLNWLLLDKHPLYPTSESILNLQNKLYEQLIKLDANISRTCSDLPDLDKIACNYASILGAWCSPLINEEEYCYSQSDIKKLSSTDNSLATNFLRGITMSHRDWLYASRMQEQLKNEWRKLYQEFNVVLCPVMPTAAFPHDHSVNPDLRIFDVDGMTVPYSHQYIWTCIATLFGLPATVIPIGFTENKLPVGIQIVGDYLQDRTTIKFVQLVEEELGGFVPPNNYFSFILA